MLMKMTEKNPQKDSVGFCDCNVLFMCAPGNTESSSTFVQQAGTWQHYVLYYCIFEMPVSLFHMSVYVLEPSYIMYKYLQNNVKKKATTHLTKDLL